MTENQNMNTPYSPEKLLIRFTQSRFVFYLLTALVIHVIFISATSVTYVYNFAYDHWIDPEGAPQRKALALALKQQAASPSQPTAPVAPSTAKGSSAAGTSTVTSASTPSSATATTGAVTPAASGSTPSADRTNTAMMKQITEVAKPSEIPKAPDDLGISIKDTNPP